MEYTFYSAVFAAVLLAAGAYILPEFLTGTLGLFLVSFSALKWKYRGAAAAAFWATAVMTALFLLPNKKLSFTGFMVGSLGYWILGFSVGKTIDVLQRQKQELLKRKKALDERIKELECLYTTSKIFGGQGSMKEKLTKTAKRLPYYWQDSKKASARLVCRGEEYASENFQKSSIMQASEIVVDGAPIGTVEIYYPENDCQNNVFLPEEKKLLDAIADILSNAIASSQAKEALQKSEENISLTLKSIGDGVIATDAQGVIERMNPTAEELTGWSAKEALGQPLENVFSITHDKTGEKAENPAKRALKTGEVTELADDIILTARDGTKRHIADTAAPIRNRKEDEIQGVIIVFSDITEQYRTNEKLRWSKAFVRSTINALPANICVLDETGTIVDTNQSWYDFARENHADIETVNEGSNYLQICENAQGDDRETALKFAAGIRDVIQGTRELFTLEYPCHSPDKKRWFVGRVTPHLTTNKGLRWVVVAHENITQRKAAENELLQTTQELETFFRVTPDLLCIADTYGNFIKTNKAWEEILGYPAQELENRKFLEFIHPEDIEATQEAIRRLKKQEDVLNFVNRYRSQDGSYHFIEWRSKPQGKKIYAASRDITERKKMEEDLKFRLSFEKMVSDISSYLVSLPVAQIDNGIEHVLQQAGMFFAVDRSYVFQFSKNGQIMSNTHEWCDKGVRSQKERIQNQPVSSFRWLLKILRNEEYVSIFDIDALPPKAEAEKHELKSQDVQSLLLLPIRKRGEILGFFGFDSVKENRVFTEAQVVLLKVIAELISDALERQQAEKKIEYLTFHDRLTGLYNRAFAEEEMKRLNVERQMPLSIIIGDLNDLKETNDTLGHKKGDALLKKAAKILRISCRSEDILARWGGDEFLLLLPKTDENEAQGICARIRGECEKRESSELPVSIALGSATKETEEQDIKEVFQVADQRMYENKNRMKDEEDRAG